MFFLFADESGDVNFKTGTRHFVYVGILTKSKKNCEQKLNDLKSGYKDVFRRKFQKKELKASKLEKDEFIYFLDGLRSLDYEVFYAAVDTYDSKKDFNTSGDDRTKRAYLLQLVISSAFLANAELGKIVIDQGLSKDVRDELRERLNEKFKAVPLIEAERSHNVAGIQIADLVAWTVRKHLGGDNLLYTYIEDKIRAKIEL